MTTSGPRSWATEPELQPTATFQPLPEPVVLGDRYRLSGVIGRGGMAVVYRADDVKLAREVAVKILLDGAGDETDRERFIAEAKTLAMLSHSGLVTVLDAGFGTSGQQEVVPDDGAHDRPFLVMELVDGHTMVELMKDGPMPLEDLAPIAAQVAEALAYVHARGVVHRDVKPGNVLVRHDGAVKLADFGIARLVEQQTHHTRTGVAVGTAAYIAPEQVTGGTAEGSADVYALGLVMLEAVTGRRTYDGPPAEAALARLQRPPEIPELAPGWRDLLTGMTALDPADRPSAADVAAWLRAGLRSPAPVGTVGVPDAATSPILAAGRPDGTGAGPTQPLTNPRGVATTPTTPPRTSTPATPPRTSAVARSGESMARQARELSGRVRAVPAEAWGVGAAFAALVLLMVVLALARGTDAAPAIPDNTPAELREPLSELHVAVNGEDG